jgi:hypothetical protein
MDQARSAVIDTASSRVAETRPGTAAVPAGPAPAGSARACPPDAEPPEPCTRQSCTNNSSTSCHELTDRDAREDAIAADLAGVLNEPGCGST